ncbi:MAG TPA: hypothetical protein VHC47_08850, partial [Mucilaginibacter sp.]|nr:hypothetical protein [Mucilaginibacter sp.]
MERKLRLLLMLFSCCFSPSVVFAQATADTAVKALTLKQCIDFALRNQPAVRQASIDEAINEKNI